MGSKKNSLYSLLAIAFIMGLLCMGCRNKGESKKEPLKIAEQLHNNLTALEQQQGWELLFDGVSFNGWRGLGRNGVQTELWKIEDGTIRKLNSGEVPSLPDGQPVEGGD